ncbi:hypothetical protein JW926_01560 [Candidatus Sumerlaeota bacterium]|nr:hypothetical protein [Candidatus Sumerlaeota bacterium]
METIAELRWKSDDEFVEVESPEKALSIIRQVDDESREQPISLDISRSDGEVMMIILGADGVSRYINVYLSFCPHPLGTGFVCRSEAEPSAFPR